MQTFADEVSFLRRRHRGRVRASVSLFCFYEQTQVPICTEKAFKLFKVVLEVPNILPGKGGILCHDSTSWHSGGRTGRRQRLCAFRMRCRIPTLFCCEK